MRHTRAGFEQLLAALEGLQENVVLLVEARVVERNGTPTRFQRVVTAVLSPIFERI